ncbi:MAG TPA: hypothetical protein VKS25_12615 [Solirubrobacteraceae bacterium]|nr:hypothetical protein [Solirubrobacteraceae bacterium]
MSRADQFVFGYDEGHRLLIASREVPRAVLVQLLVATDAVMSPDCPPLITGLPLPDTAEFALAITWPDPRAARAGAVCSHVLLLDAAALAVPGTVEALVRLARNPAGASLEEFVGPLRLDGGVSAVQPGLLSGRGPKVEVLESFLEVACRSDGPGVVIHAALDDAARAMIVIWSALWPALRSRFSFRTRELVTAEQTDFALTAALRLSGGSAAGTRTERPPPAWVEELARVVNSPVQGRLAAFLAEFGPAEVPVPLRLRRLAELWTAVAAADVEAARDQIEAHWPDPESGAALKQALFGGRAREWWPVAERDRVAALLGTRHPTWDLIELDLTGRVRALARSSSAG